MSFVPDAEQRLKRTLTRRRTQQMRDRVRIQNQVESLLEETRRFRRDQRSPETVARPTRRNRHVHQFHSGAGFIREPEKLVGICSSTPHAQPISKSISAISTAPGEPSNSPGRGFHRARVSGQCDRCDRRRRGKEPARLRGKGQRRNLECNSHIPEWSTTPGSRPGRGRQRQLRKKTWRKRFAPSRVMRSSLALFMYPFSARSEPYMPYHRPGQQGLK